MNRNPMTMIQGLNEALHQAFAQDERLVCFGEDVGYFGGVFRVTEGLQASFGDARVFNTPLCEQGIVGFAIGLALTGFKPIAEIQFADYIFPAYDQICNELAKIRYRTCGQYQAPVVIRTPYGGGILGGHYHSQSPESQFLHTPGLRVVIPSGPQEAKGLLLEALACDDPVLFFEPKRIYRSLKQDVPESMYTIALGKAHVAREGKEVTLIGYGAQHQQNLLAAEQLAGQVSVEVIDLRTLQPLDLETLVRSAQKTGRVVVAHEAPKTCGFGAEIAALLQEYAFYYLEAPIRRCCGLDTPFPHTLEDEYLPDARKVCQVVLETYRHGA